MNKLLTLLGFLLFTASAFCQISVTVSGVVADVDGNGVENIIVNISTDSLNGGFQYYATALTGADGSYSDTFEVPDNLTQGGVYVWIQDCNNSYQSEQAYWYPGGDPVVNFVYCNINCSVVITEPSPGVLQATGSGVAPFTYLWSNNSTTDTIFASVSGVYCVDITDANGCTSNTCYTYDHPNDCNETVDIHQNGAALSAVHNILDGVDYLWSNGSTSSSITAIDEGDYCVTVSYGQNCIATDCYYVYADTNQIDSCYATIFPVQNGGWLQAGSYGVAPFSYAWNTGEQTGAIEITGDTLYCVTVTDAVGCVSYACYDHFDPNECNETVYIYQNDTALSAAHNIIGEVGYSWSNGSTSSSITAVEEGDYCVTVSYGENCIATDCYYFYADTTQLDSCYLTIVPVQNGSWLQASGSGVAPFTYIWSTGEQTAAIEITNDSIYCVSVIDAQGCVAADCFVITTPVVNLLGAITAEGIDSIDLVSTINLYSIANGETTLVNSYEAFNYYYYPDIEPGDYIVQAIVDGYLPTYHESSMWWDEADVISVTTEHVYAPIHLIPLDELVAGPGGITGTASEPDGFVGHGTGGRGFTPVEGAEIVLFNSENVPVAYQFTNADGDYSFDGIAYGTYTVYIELVGYEQVYYTVTIGPDNQVANNINFTVNENSIATATKAPLLENTALNIYPNPVKGELNMNLDLELKGNASVQIINVTGQIILNDSFAQYEQQKTIDVSSFNVGLYLVKVTTEEGVIVKQFVKE